MQDGKIYKLAYFSYNKRYSAEDLADAVQLAKAESGRKQDREKNLQLSECERTLRLKEQLDNTRIEKTPEMEEILQAHLELKKTDTDGKEKDLK